MKTIQKLLPIRNLHENLALVAFMIIMFIVACFQESGAQRSDLIPKDLHPARHNEVGTFSAYRESSVTSCTATSGNYLQSLITA